MSIFRPVILLLALLSTLASAQSTRFDTNLERQVRAALGKKKGALKTEDYSALEYLNAEKSDIADLRGIGSFTSLTVLQLTGNAIADPTPLAPLHQLTFLDLGDNQIDWSWPMQWELSPRT